MGMTEEQGQKAQWKNILVTVQGKEIKKTGKNAEGKQWVLYKYDLLDNTNKDVFTATGFIDLPVGETNKYSFKVSEYMGQEQLQIVKKAEFKPKPDVGNEMQGPKHAQAQTIAPGSKPTIDNNALPDVEKFAEEYFANVDPQKWSQENYICNYLVKINKEVYNLLVSCYEYQISKMTAKKP